MTKTEKRLEWLCTQGFDESYIIRGGMIRTKCGSCAAAVINGIPCHETGCPNAMHECAGCNETLPIRQKYCADCMS